MEFSKNADGWLLVRRFPRLWWVGFSRSSRSPPLTPSPQARPQPQGPENTDDLGSGKWRVYLRGPAGTPYEGGVFKVTFTVSLGAAAPAYPFAPPENFTFETGIWHPRVDAKSGACCLGLSASGTPAEPPTWSAATMSLANMPVLLLAVLASTEGGANEEAMKQAVDNMPAFTAQAKAWTAKHAKL